MSRREYAGAAAATTISGAITPTSLTITIAASTGWPDGSVGPFIVVLGRGTASEEKVLVTSRTTTSLTVASLSHRGYDGTTAVAHDAGVAIEHCLGAMDLDEPNAHINDTTLDHHTQYHNAARHAAVAHTTAMIEDGAVSSAKLVSAQRAEAGDIKWSARSTPTTGWLLCDGTAYSRTTYATLFAAIGTTFGAGDGSTTFNVPDIRGRVMMGVGTGTGLTARTLGATTGGETTTLTTTELPAHTHAIDHDHASVTSSATSANHSHSVTVTGTAASGGAHTHTLNAGGYQFVVGALASSAHYINVGATTDHGAAGADVEVTYTAASADSNGAHTHTVSASGTTDGQSADHTHTVDLPAFTGTSGSAGSGAAFTNMQPSIALNCFIKS